MYIVKKTKNVCHRNRYLRSDPFAGNDINMVIAWWHIWWLISASAIIKHNNFE